MKIRQAVPEDAAQIHQRNSNDAASAYFGKMLWECRKKGMLRWRSDLAIRTIKPKMLKALNTTEFLMQSSF